MFKTHAIFSYAHNTKSLIFEVTIPSSENYFSPMFEKIQQNDNEEKF